MRSSACLACRRRKSRCKTEPGLSTTCLMCRSHGTTCRFPPTTPRRRNGPRNTEEPRVSRRGTTATADADELPHMTANPNAGGSPTVGHLPTMPASDGPQALHTPGCSDSAQRLVGPIFGSDTQAVSEIVSSQDGGIQRLIRIMRTDPVDPVVFTKTRRRPVNLGSPSGSNMTSLEIIQRLLEPFLPRLLELFLKKVNPCLPLLDSDDFTQIQEGLVPARNQSPALLACLYAHAMTFWSSDSALATQHRPDHRFVWNLASEMVYSELRTNPSLDTIAATLLSIGGRPSTLVLNNVGQLGFAINMAFTFGLHRNPYSWDIPEREKRFRMRVWWALLLNDRWSSLAYGIPPRMRPNHSDMPSPTVDVLADEGGTSAHIEAARNYVTLAGLTDVLHDYLDTIHDLQAPSFGSHQALRTRLHAWAESTCGEQRKIILRGSDLSQPGAANLRLATLSVTFLQSRIELQHQRQAVASDTAFGLLDTYLHARRAAEDVSLFVGELGISQLQDFWLPVAGTLITCVMTFLMRSAIDMESRVNTGSSDNGALRIARDLINSLIHHKEIADWDIADSCIAQHSQALQKLETMHNDQALGEVDSRLLNDFLLESDFLDPNFFL